MVKTLLGCILASALVVAACSSSSSSGTSTNSGGLGGLFSGNKSGSGGTSTTGNVVPSDCTVNPAEDTCTTCLKQSCCTPLQGCSGSAECNALVNCVAGCNGVDACNTNCVNAHPDGQVPVKAVIDCGTESCEAPCQIDTSTSSSSSSSSSSGSTGTCLSDPPDDELCSTVPGKPHPKDCPDGPPNAQCVASPANLHGIYCCP